jgi:predicted transcriptional regulator
VSTIIRILETKGFVGHKAYGKTHEYYPIITKEKYTKFYLNNLIKGYFDGSFQNLVSFFAKENKMDIKELEKLLNEVKKQKS